MIDGPTSWRSLASGAANAPQLAQDWIAALPTQWQQRFDAWEPQLDALRQRDWTWARLSLLLLAVPWGGGAIAYHWLTAMPAAPNCQAPQWSQADFERLQCLHRTMQSGETRHVLAGIRQLKAWPQESSVYGVAQRMLEDWSIVVWSQAQVEFEAGEWEQSAQLIAEIPEQFEEWRQVQQRFNLWQEVRQQGETLYQLAEAAIQAQNWQQALDHAQELARLDNDYWRRQGLHELPSRIEARQAAAPSEAGDRPLIHALSSAAPSSAPQRPGLPLAPLGFSTVRPSVTRPSVTEPGWIQPEFSAA